MFVTALEMNNLDCTRTDEQFTACLWEGLIHEWKHTLLAPPLSLYVGKQLTAVSHTATVEMSCL